MSEPATALHVTPLIDRHRALGARLVEFGGWLMPVQYRGILEEHRAVREAAGLFDLSHMGEIYVEGPDADAALSFALVSDPRSLPVGRAQYTMICNAAGGIIDDMIVYRLESERFLVVPNASNARAVSDALAERLEGFRAILDDETFGTALVGIQGPRAADLLAPLTDVDLEALAYYAIAAGSVAGIPGLVARTGYTGEDGFEIFVDGAAAADLWDALAASGDGSAPMPVGLGARDTLRLEAGMPLYGNELDAETTPFEARLGRVVRLAKAGDFVGRGALELAEEQGPRKLLVGLTLEGRGIARHGYRVWSGDRSSGMVTSGTMSPTLGTAIAMAYVAPEDAEIGTMLDVEIREQRVPAQVVPMPFYRRPG